MKVEKKIVILFINISFILNVNAQHFSSLQNGVHSSEVRCMFTDTVADLLYVSGHFLNAGGVSTHNIASWNGTNWDSLGAGLNHSNNWIAYALAMCRYNNELCIGGGFIQAGLVNTHSMARWDGNTWYSFPSEPLGGVIDMIVFNGELYIGGQFDSVGSLPVNGLAKWNGTSWSDAAFPNYQIGNSTNPVYCMAEYQGNLYVAGNFGASSTHSRIAYWDGTLWQAMPNGGIIGGADWVSDMVVYNNELYVAGYFHIAEGNIGDNIQKWNGITWSAVGGGTGGPNGQIAKLLVYHNKLYAMGVFQTAGGIPADRIATWDGTNWCSLGSTFDNTIGSGAVYHDSLYIGGGFWTIDSDSMYYISKWIGGDYTANCTTVGINEETNTEEISIYPNPASKELGIRNYELGIKQVKIYNMLGEEVNSHWSLVNSKSVTIDVSGLASGMYFVEVYFDKLSNRGAVRKKFVKE